MKQKFNSSIYACLYCEGQNKIKRNKELIKQSTNKSIKSRFSINTKCKSKKTDRQKAMNKADMWFSRYIRIKYSFYISQSGDVMCKCIVTGVVKLAKNMDNGHCFSRRFKTLRYNEDNCRPQNRSSNRFSGEADHYRFIDNVKAEIGEEKFNELDRLRHEVGEDDETFNIQQANKYKELINTLLVQLKAKKWW